MLAAELIAVVHVDVVGTEAGLRPLRARYQNELIVQEHSAREIIRRRGHEAKGEIDQAGPEPAVHLQAFARPQCESDLGAVPAHVLEEALPDAPPKIELQADVADALESLGKGDLVAGLAPELGHHLGITLEFESRGGELGAGLPPMQQLLSDLLLQGVQPGGHRRLGDMEPARCGDQTARLDYLKKGAQGFEIHDSILSNLMAK
jgi:hypothetical protein